MDKIFQFKKWILESNLLFRGGYGTNNYYENINSTEEFASLVSSYVDAG